VATQPRFSFDFAELRQRPPELRVLPAASEDLPPDAEPVPAEARPGWIEPLPPFFAGGPPLRVDVARAAPAGRLLLQALAGLFATAGADSGLEVRRWSGGFAVGAPGFATVTGQAHAVLVPSDLAPAEITASATVLRIIHETDPWLVLSRSVPALDRAFGLRAEPFTSLPRQRLWRLADLDASELRALAEGRCPSLGLGRFSRRCVALAGAITRSYRASLR
jgi:hypothetical protein